MSPFPLVNGLKILLCKDPKSSWNSQWKPKFGIYLASTNVTKGDTKGDTWMEKSERSLLMVLPWLFWKIHIQLGKKQKQSKISYTVVNLFYAN